MTKSNTKKAVKKNEKMISHTIDPKSTKERALSFLPTQIKNENEKLMEDRANEMAIYFEKNIGASELARWLLTANSYCTSFPAPVDQNGGDGIIFINEVGIFILADLINCKTKEDKIELLKEQIPFVFDNAGYEGSKESLADIGNSFLKSFVRYKSDENSISEFMKTYTCLLCLGEMYSAYSFYEKQLYKEEKAA